MQILNVVQYNAESHLSDVISFTIRDKGQDGHKVQEAEKIFFDYVKEYNADELSDVAINEFIEDGFWVGEYYEIYLYWSTAR